MLDKISISLGYLITTKLAYIVHLGAKFIGIFLTFSSDSVEVIAMFLKSCFSFVLITSFDYLDISLDIIEKLTLGSTISAEITRHLILHLRVTTSVADSFL